MIDVMVHRGPDGEGIHVSGPIGLAHRRLSIIDVEKGAQPICNEDGSVWTTFNGEIYNYRDVRKRLVQAGHLFRTESDTEVIVHLWEEHGPECLQFLDGMFAFAIWDERQNVLFLARDRVGIKPLYYSLSKGSLTFASELKAVVIGSAWAPTVDVGALDSFLAYRYLPGERTLIEQVQKLAPGHYMLAHGGHVRTTCYWDLSYRSDHWNGIEEAAEALDELLRGVVRSHMISDVSVGILASGGLDSTAIMSYAAEDATSGMQSFTVGFSEGVVDERPYARLAADRYGTRHRETSLSAAEFEACLPRYVWHMEEPVCEPPAIALYHVSRLARQHVKVLLSGEGGDEAFAGYPEYRNYLALEQYRRVVGPLGGLSGSILASVGRMSGSKRFMKYAGLLRGTLAGNYLSRSSTPQDYLYRQKECLYSDELRQALGSHSTTRATSDCFDRVSDRHQLNQMLYVDAKTWLPDDLLLKADKMSMAASVELRVPFLDHRVLEFAAGLPPDFKVRGAQTKRILRRIFRKRLPTQILSRRKAGFPVPYERWIRGPLREMVADTVLSHRAHARGYFRREAVERVVADGLSGARGASAREVFTLFVLELWHCQFIDRDTPVELPVTNPTADFGQCPSMSAP